MAEKSKPKVRDGRGKVRFTYERVPPKPPRKARQPKKPVAVPVKEAS